MVHDLPKSYPKVYVEFDITNRLGTADGSYAADGDQITLAQGQTGTEITFVHEFGHHVTLAEEGNYSLDQFQDKIDRTPTLRRWRDAVEATPTYEKIRKRWLDDGEDYAGYLKDERELFARSYAQYIARRSGDATLNDQLERNRSKNRDFQWPDDEFIPIADALDDHFRKHLTAAAATTTATTLHLEGQHDQATHGRRGTGTGTGNFTGWDGAQSRAVEHIPNGESWLRPDGMSVPVNQHSDVTPSHSREGYLQLAEKAKVIRVVADAWSVDMEQFEVSTTQQREAIASAVATGTRNFTLEANDAHRTHYSANLLMPEYDEVIRELEKANRALRNKNPDDDFHLQGQDLANDCHDPHTGRFCETSGSGGRHDWHEALRIASPKPQGSKAGKYWLSKDGRFIPVAVQHSEFVPKGTSYQDFVNDTGAIRITGLDYPDADIDIRARVSAEQVTAIVTHVRRPHIYVVATTSSAERVIKLDDPSAEDLEKALDSVNEIYTNSVPRNRPKSAAFLQSETEDLANDCHNPNDGRFCETPGGSGERDIPVKPYNDEDKEFDRVAQLEKHYGRKEQAPEMGGIQWAFNGQSPVITEAAEDVLAGSPYDPFDRYTSYGKDGYDVAETILTTIENESSDVTLYSGHKRSREAVQQIIEEGVSFPLVATSPDRRLAEIYARGETAGTPAVVFEFPPGTQSGFYQANEHIATGEFEVTTHQWSEGIAPNGVKYPTVTITLRQTKRYTVPEKVYPDEEE